MRLGEPVPALNGTMFFGLVVDADGVLNVNLSAATSATAPDPVPEPSVTLSLLAGLGVLCVILRRRLAGGVLSGIPSEA